LGVLRTNVQGRREGEISKKRWLDTTESDMRAAGVCIGDVDDRYKWTSRTRVADPK